MTVKFVTPRSLYITRLGIKHLSPDVPEKGGRFSDPYADQQQATSILAKLGVAMSRTLTSVPTDNIALPVSNSGSDHSQALRRSTDSSWSQRSRNRSDQRPPLHQNSLRGVWRHTIGIILLLATVVLWTASNFLASVGAVEGKIVALQTDKLTYRLSLLTIATPSHTLSPMSTHLSSPSCC